MSNRFGKVGASRGSITRAFIISTCGVSEASSSEMLRQQFRFSLGHGGEVLLQCPRNPLVDLLTSSPQQVVVSDVPHQRMFEAVAGFGRSALGKRQPRVNESRNSGANVSRGSRAHHLQHGIRKLLPNY